MWGTTRQMATDFFYRQNVIKPALVGLAGPWISGGVEFNWPQHHRPATFMPVEVRIKRNADGSVIVWCSDHDPMLRMNGMHGVCLYPGKAYLELKVRLYNRTEQVQTFLWWANTATRVHEKYQSFFPGDVRFVADHAKRAVTSFPLSDGHYYGIDYGQRAKSGVPPEDQPRMFVPDGSYPANDLSWYANIPVPTSYMATGSALDFFGGYDHAAQAGVVHVANHHVSPGKKQWTWGNHEFGYAWDRNLTDNDGPYVELMAGVLYRQSTGFFIPVAWRNQELQPVLVSHSKNRSASSGKSRCSGQHLPGGPGSADQCLRYQTVPQSAHPAHVVDGPLRGMGRGSLGQPSLAHDTPHLESGRASLFVGRSGRPDSD